MANTKNMDRNERKKAKRQARHQLKKLYASLSKKERSQFHTSNVSLKKFVQDLKKDQTENS